MKEKKLIDDCFYVEQTRWKTWNSYDKEGKNLITSLTEKSCISATRFFLKNNQENKNNKIYETFIERKF